MTVNELLTKLAQMPPNVAVFIVNADNTVEEPVSVELDTTQNVVLIREWD